MSNIAGIVEQLKHERARIDKAINALAEINRYSSSRSGGRRKRRKMSAAARAKIAAAQRARWARQKRVAKTT